MEIGELQRKMYGLRDPSVAQRLTLAGFAGVWVAVAWWLLFSGGLAAAGGWFGRNWMPGDPVRRACLGAAFSIYYIRILFTEFVFLKRGVSWSEVFSIVMSICCWALPAERTQTRRAWCSRWAWRCSCWAPGSNSLGRIHAAHLETAAGESGPAVHRGIIPVFACPNYFGDLVSFSGLALTSGAWLASVIPAIMLAGFVFFNIPILDAHLRDHYGAAFEQYARRTRKSIPFVYCAAKPVLCSQNCRCRIICFDELSSIRGFNF